MNALVIRKMQSECESLISHPNNEKETKEILSITAFKANSHLILIFESIEAMSQSYCVVLIIIVKKALRDRL